MRTSEHDLGYGPRSFDTSSGEFRLIKVKRIGGDEGVVVRAPNEKRIAEDWCYCYWLYVVRGCKSPQGRNLMTIRDPAQLEWSEIRKIDH